MAQERPVLRCQHRVRPGASGVPSVCRTEPARTSNIILSTELSTRRRTVAREPNRVQSQSPYDNDETAPPGYDRCTMVRRRPKTSTHETHAKPNDNTNSLTRYALTANWLKLGVLHRSAGPSPNTIADACEDSLGATLRQPTERGRRARTQAAWSFVSRVSRRVRARAGVADERGVSHLSLVRRAVHPNAEPPGVPEHRTGKRPEHRTRDTGPDRTPDLNPLTRINLQAVRGEGAPGEPTLDQVAQSPE